MKRLATLTHVALAIWVFNMFLWFMLQMNPAAYASLRANGAQWFTCMDWDSEGRPFASDQCTDAPPVYEPGL